MAARTPRRSFAAPFVVTLAAIPACYVQTSPGPSGPPPSQPPPTQTAEPAHPTTPPPGPVVTNPPRPTQPPPSQPSQPPPYRPDPRPSQPPPYRPDPRPSQPPPPTQTPASQPTTPPSQQAQEGRWRLYKAQDGNGCMAAIHVECQPKATCNPPPPFRTACPDGISLDKPVTVVTQDGGASCFVEFEMPKCPPGTACNPPRPRPVACPKR